MDARAISTAVGAGLAALFVMSIWGWREHIRQSHPIHFTEESWEQAKQLYPLPQGILASTGVTKAVAEGIVKANPFSPQRRFTPPTVVPDDPSVVLAPAAPQFIFKGQIRVGTRVRAIVEDTTIPKTYFLEVGQEVAGFKVLDISSTQVILSDPQTHEDVVVPLVSSGTSGQDAGVRKAPGAPREP